MPVEVVLPKVDMDMTEGTLSVWHVAEGDSVAKGTALFDIETDKAAMEVEAPATGILRNVVARPGERLPVGTVIAWIYPEGESIEGSPVAAMAAPPARGAAAVEPAGRTDDAEPTARSGTVNRPRATPLARRLARLAGVELGGIQGTGPRQRIQRLDIEAALAARLSPALPAAPVRSGDAAADRLATVYADRPYVEVPLDGMRTTVAARLTEAKQTVPHFYLRRSARMDRLMALREQANAEIADRGVKLSVNDFIIRACALALQQVPDANAVWAGDRMYRFTRSDIAVAVAVEGGLFTPVIRDAEAKTVAVLSAEMKDLAARARARKLKPQDYAGGSMAISNLGMFGVESFDAIINPPHGSILAVGAALPRKVLEPDGSETAAVMMALTLSVDHRAMDGALGAQLLAAIVRNLENPVSLLL